MILWKNGFIHEMGDSNQIYSNMATNQGLIVGFDDEIKHLNYDQEIDLNHSHVYPGFVDAHMHLLGYGQMLLRPNLTGFKNKFDILAFLKSHFNHEKLFVEGYFECGITKEDLDLISLDYPIMLRHNDYHSLTVNQKVLDMMAFDHQSGVLTERDADQAMKTYPRTTKDELKSHLEAALKSLYRYGITGAHSDDLSYYNSFDETFLVFEEVLEQYPFRTHLLVHHNVLDDYIASKKPFLDQTKYLQIGAVKMFYDGTISSKTALMKDPYKDTNNYGMNVNGYETFVDLVKTARKNHLPVAVHIIGDQALDEVLDILKKYPPSRGQKDRLIHTPWVMKSSLKKLEALSISIDIQPQFLSSDLPWALSYLSKTPDLCFPWKTLAKTHVNLAGSSDAPVEIPNPLLGIYAAVERKSRHDQIVYFEDEKLSLKEAIKLYTINANYNTEKSNRGLIKKGYIADFSVFEADLETIEPQRLLTDLVTMTVIDEKIVYQKY